MRYPVPLAVALLSCLAALASGPLPPEPRMKLLDLKPDELADPKAAARVADAFEAAYKDTTPPEAVRMLLAILRGPKLTGADGWFGPAQTRYTWKWLAQRLGVDPASGGISRKQFRGSDAHFARLDRDGDGTIAPGDFDWSERNPWVQQAYLANRFFRRMDPGGDGKVTRDDLEAFFQRAARGKDHLTSEDLRDALLAGAGGFLPGDAPTVPMLVRALQTGELGSLDEGPAAEQAAPDFTLKTPDGERTYQLSKLVGPKPVVLVFGNFTCGPFRSFCPDVDAVYQRHKDAATFLMVYVREAHPTNGWVMESNKKVGVAVEQPTTYAARVGVCEQFCRKVKPLLPVVVDDVDDRVGNAYSAMPARFYVIDAQGQVAFKSGRGPFGFKVAEMEQALVLALLEQATGARP